MNHFNNLHLSPPPFQLRKVIEEVEKGNIPGRKECAPHHPKSMDLNNIESIPEENEPLDVTCSDDGSMA